MLITKDILQHLKWMIQKGNLNQDMCLMGLPGPMRRQLVDGFNQAFLYCQLAQREVEFVALSRDVTDSDLKQRREITNRCAVFTDQPAVRAAINGRVLILDGIEKAERNVLPVLNNLLENREMALEDGRFLVSPSRYDNLINNRKDELLNQAKLVRASDRFIVIALGLPVPVTNFDIRNMMVFQWILRFEADSKLDMWQSQMPGATCLI